VEDAQKSKAWNVKALSKLEEANLTVKKLAKLDVPGRSRTNTIEKFLKKGHTSYKPIFNTLSKFTVDMEEILSEFKDSLHLLKWVKENLHRELMNRRKEVKL
jgi:hypothetical protein